jgi:hypothetical protein
MRKSIVVIFNQLNIKNNKNDKDNLKKKHNKKNHMRKHCSNQRCFKGKKAKLSTGSIRKKINLTITYLEKKNIDKKTCGETL